MTKFKFYFRQDFQEKIEKQKSEKYSFFKCDNLRDENIIDEVIFSGFKIFCYF